MKSLWFLFAMTAGLAMPQTEPQNPFKNDPQAAEAGRGIFRIYCSPCHGIRADGGKGTDLTRGIYSAGERDADLLAVISNGPICGRRNDGTRRKSPAMPRAATSCLGAKAPAASAIGWARAADVWVPT